MQMQPSSSFDCRTIEDLQVTLSDILISPGGVVSGSLTFRVTQPTAFRRVAIKIVGKESVHCAITQNRQNTTAYQQHFHSRVNVHKEHVTLLGDIKTTGFVEEDTSSSSTLPPGDYNFPFAFVVPTNAPPSVPAVKAGTASGVLNWYVKARINVPRAVTDPSASSIFTVVTVMPLSQYRTREPIASPLHHASRTCCLCCDQGVTTSQTNISQNMVVFGKDTSLDGNIMINNSDSSKDTDNIVVSLHRACWINAGGCQGTPLELISSTTIQSNMKAGDGEQRFNFSLSLPNTPNLVTSYLGHYMYYYYPVTVTCDGDTLFTTKIIASNALDNTNSCSLAIDVKSPGPIVHTKQYRRYVYAPPPEAQPSYPLQMPLDYIPRPTDAVTYILYPGVVPMGQPMPAHENNNHREQPSSNIYCEVKSDSICKKV